MQQLDMFKETVVKGKRTIVIDEVAETTANMKYADNYIKEHDFGGVKDSKWYYTQDRYKLLHHLMSFCLGKKNKQQGFELADIMGIRGTEKLRGMINELRNDPFVDVIIGSNAGGYFIAYDNEKYDAVKYIFGKAVNEMITAIRMLPELAPKFIKIAQVTYRDMDKACDSQIMAQFDKDVEEIISEIVVRYADTMRRERYRKGFEE